LDTCLPHTIRARICITASSSSADSNQQRFQPNGDAATPLGSRPHLADPRPQEFRPKSSGSSKAGRKPINRTDQERRDRNRRAQLAFRARRSDYLAKLEEKCRSLEDLVAQLKESKRVATEALARERARVIRLDQMLRTRPVMHWPPDVVEAPDMFLPASLDPGHPYYNASSCHPEGVEVSQMFPWGIHLGAVKAESPPRASGTTLTPNKVTNAPEFMRGMLTLSCVVTTCSDGGGRFLVNSPSVSP
jgi:hypothetical protein